ncbi:three component ABC system middle component [Pseudomonas putida]|uniref:three component ABC system middle component n=1 Tax=Pseudomonas putida TaxID=303 RepID=UPI001F07984B|nr:three component ABC system middle component [Pseudomonas putida]WQE52195.1 three component ABC system middle component [Pseudomonas putida]
MSTPHLDKHLIHNSSLACFLLVFFIDEYCREKSEHPIDLPKLLLVLPLVWNEAVRNALEKRTTRSSAESIIREYPILKVDLSMRVKAHAATTFQGLNLAKSANLIATESDSNGSTSFSRSTVRWPKGAKTQISADMLKTTRQLAIWFSTLPTELIYRLFFGIKK